jgi:hypothetical protein
MTKTFIPKKDFLMNNIHPFILDEKIKVKIR